MSRVRGTLLSVCLVFAFSCQSNGDTTTIDQQMDLLEVEQQIIKRTNAERSRHGLPVLTTDVDLMKSARSHTVWMAQRTALRHTSDLVAENIAKGQETPTQAVRAWMNSSGHRANILSSSYSRIGVAAYRGSDGRVYWCQQFLR